MTRESPAGDERPRILLLILAIAAVLGFFACTAGCTTSSTTTPNADSGIGAGSTASGAEPSDVTTPSDPQQGRIQPNGTHPEGTFPGHAAPNGTPPAGAPPGDRNLTGTAPGGIRPDGTPPAARVGSAP